EVHRLLPDHPAGAVAGTAGADDALGLLQAGTALRRRGGAHAASSAVSWDATISWYVGQSASSSSCVPRPTTSPSSRTRIRSASRMVETRWATTSTVESRVTGARAARSLAS